MTLAHPHFLWLLLLVPVMGIYLIYFRPHDLPGFRFSSVQKIHSHRIKVTRDKGTIIIGILRILAVVAIIIALARPQKGLQSEELTTKATDIMFCLDASRSMLSIDFKPQNRFEVAKDVISEFIKKREFDRMGIVLFAQHALTQCPLTLDKNALLNILDFIQVGVIPPDQTAIGLGLAASVNRLKDSVAKSKVIVLVTDGSNNAGSIDPLTAAKTAAAYGIKIYAIGAGSPEGGMIPINDPVFGQRLVKGGLDLDEDTLLKISSESKGKYFRAKSTDALQKIFQEIDQLEKTDINIKEYVDYEELYFGFLMAGLCLLLIELLLAKTIFRTVP